jgi:hypothetical protein
LEGLALLTLAVLVYAHTGWGWGRFFALLLAPDLSFLGWLGGPRAGAAVYNLVHTTVGPLVLVALGFLLPWALPLGLVWLAHIGLDRACGYGMR